MNNEQNLAVLNFSNNSTVGMSLEYPEIFLEPGSEIRQSWVSDGLYMEKYSSYVSDSQISAFCHIGPRTSVGGFEHPTDNMSQSSFFWGQNTKLFPKSLSVLSGPSTHRPVERRTTLEPDVWVGSNCVIKSGLKVALGSVLGAGSVLTKNTEPYGIYVGNPAKFLRFRFVEETISKLVESKWWDLPLSVLSKIDFGQIQSAIQSVLESRKKFKN